jgi:hypothetical protein
MITEARRQELIQARDVLNLALAGEVAVNIGQLEPEEIRALNKAVKSGELVTWRGKWFPVTGASFGMGPDKTCWGTPEAKDRVTLWTGIEPTLPVRADA